MQATVGVVDTCEILGIDNGSSLWTFGDNSDSIGRPFSEESGVRVFGGSLARRPFLLNTDSRFLKDCRIGDHPFFFSRLSGVVRLVCLEDVMLALGAIGCAAEESDSNLPTSSFVVRLRVNVAVPLFESCFVGIEKYES